MTAKRNIQECLIDRFGLPEAQRLGASGSVGLLPCVEDKTPYEPPTYEGCELQFSCNERMVLVILDDRAAKEQERANQNSEPEDGPSVRKVPRRRLIDLRPISGDAVPDFGPAGGSDPLGDIFN